MKTRVVIKLRNGDEIKIKDPAVRATINSGGEAIWHFNNWQKNVDMPGFCVRTEYIIPIQNIVSMEFVPLSGVSEVKENIDRMVEMEKERND